jgi:hypothetical protein
MQAGCGGGHQLHGKRRYPYAVLLLPSQKGSHCTPTYASKRSNTCNIQPSLKQGVNRWKQRNSTQAKGLQLTAAQHSHNDGANLIETEPQQPQQQQQPGSWRWGSSLPACYLPATANRSAAAVVAPDSTATRTAGRGGGAAAGAGTLVQKHTIPAQQQGAHEAAPPQQTQPIVLHPWTFDEPAEAADAAAVRSLEQQRMHR